MYNILQLQEMQLPELQTIAKQMKINKAESIQKDELVYKILDQQAIDAAGKKVALEKEKAPKSTTKKVTAKQTKSKPKSKTEAVKETAIDDKNIKSDKNLSENNQDSKVSAKSKSIKKTSKTKSTSKEDDDIQPEEKSNKKNIVKSKKSSEDKKDIAIEDKDSKKGALVQDISENKRNTKQIPQAKLE